MTILTPLAVALGKVAGQLSRRLGQGGGTTLPGALARRIAPDILRDLSAGLPHGALLISGTNGKTTTSRMISEILTASGERVLHNRAGANLIAGLTATAVADASWAGRLRASIGLFETDEAALPQAVAEVRPRLVLIHNLFRDQLDRYGEVDTVAATWRAALADLPPDATLVLNADDPAVADLGRDLAARVVYYGLDDARHAAGAGAHIADSQFCRRCGARYTFSLAFYAHIGHYSCPRCGHARPDPDVRLARLELQGTAGSRSYITYPGGAMELDLPLPGLYNALNALAACAAATSLGVAPRVVRGALEQFSAAFGRIERLSAGPGGAPMLIALIKNPVGATETVRMLIGESAAAEGLHLLIAINDRYADGTDVSWLWDAEFESLAGAARVTVSGTRADDMAVRLKYAGLPEGRIHIAPELPAAVDAALAGLPAGATLFLLPTYTAMLELREDLAARGWVRQFWEE
ncbi:MurT ligase domain-containing protein [Oscillochloris sp. ZM17-4]|uniref:Mur ligase family protein n=1 Tax=Oscillochloris sp. ZM17-4 TaxID=2866714 RepID=UPI001C72E22E|nr:MurT ligase domain-containing protein [Oscillochloris sp. ZM17-4]MBX0327426.1 MurT ligase domain-containing protein [Oscillochloris sp. ZM17-4]